MKMENLVTGIGASVQQAYKLLEWGSMQDYLQNYFAEQAVAANDAADTAADVMYQPRTVTVCLPDKRQLKVPLLVLANHGSMNIDYVKLKMNVKVTGEDKNNIQVTSAAAPESENAADTGELEMLFKVREPTEGLARIETNLNGML